MNHETIGPDDAGRPPGGEPGDTGTNTTDETTGTGATGARGGADTADATTGPDFGGEDMHAADSGDTREQATVLSRQETFPLDGRGEIQVRAGAGLVDVNLVEEAAGTAHVSIAVIPQEGDVLSNGLSGLLGWVGAQIGSQVKGQSRDELASQAVAETRIELIHNRLVVTGPREFMPRTVPLSVTIVAPPGCRVSIGTDTAAASVRGVAGRLDVTTGTGAVNIDDAHDELRVSSGSGAIRVGTTHAATRVKSGTGRVSVSSVRGPSSVKSGSGDLWFGTVEADLSAKSGAGDVTVADAGVGGVSLRSGTGAIRVGIRAGVNAEVDVSSGIGHARSDLDVSRQAPPTDAPVVRLQAHTATGSAIVTTAT